MKIYRNGFTLVELLAVIVVLAIIFAIAVPNVIHIIDNTRKDSFLSTASMMIKSARTKMSSNAKYVPSAGYVKAILLTNLDMDSAEKDADGGTYGANSYVYIAKDNSNAVHFYVTLQGSKRAINHVEENNVETAIPGTSATAVAPITEGQTVILEEMEYGYEAIP